jgi:hypothetical protein
MGVRVPRSAWLSAIKMLSPTKRTLLKEKESPLDVVSCPIRHPLSAFRLPLFWV